MPIDHQTRHPTGFLGLLFSVLCLAASGCGQAEETVAMPEWLKDPSSGGVPGVPVADAAVPGAAASATAAPAAASLGGEPAGGAASGMVSPGTSGSAPVTFGVSSQATANTIAPPGSPASAAPQTFTTGAVNAGSPAAAGGSPYYEGQPPPAAGSFPGMPAGTPQGDSSPATGGPVALSLQIRAGDRIPMRKVVNTVLTQVRNDGTSDAHRTRTEIDMTLIAEEVQPLQTRWGVEFNRVRIARNMDGREMTFEAKPGVLQATDDVEVRAYQAMIQNGFSFVVDGTNRVTSVDGFEQFLAACLGGVTPSGGQVGLDPATAVSDFVDPSIGALPFSTPLSVGQQLTVHGAVTTPLQMEWREIVTISSLDTQTVTINGTANVPAAQTPGASVEVLGGSIQSQATIFRESGLPQLARRNETIQMLARLSGGEIVPQTKTTVTTVEAFPRSVN